MSTHPQCLVPTSSARCNTLLIPTAGLTQAALQFTAGNEDPEGPPLASTARGPPAPVTAEEREELLRRPCIEKAARREWELALRDYRASTSVFQRSRNLPGAIFASSNAALVSAQLGDDAEALKVSSPHDPCSGRRLL